MKFKVLYTKSALKNPIFGQYRFRVGAYRVIFDLDEDGQIHVLMVLAVKYRKDIYNI